MFFRFFFYVSILERFFAREFSLFPLYQYMNDTNLNDSAPFLCQQQDSNIKFCNCDDTCFASKSCCIDKLWNSTNPLSIDIYLDMLINESMPYNDLACTNVIPVAIGLGHKSNKILMVSSCQDSADMQDQINCFYKKQYSGYVPVIGFDKRVYRNADCARCNFINFTNLNLSFECQTKTEKESIKIIKEGFENKEIDYIEDILERYENCTVSLFRSQNTYDCSFPENEEICPISSKYYKLCNAYSGIFLNFKNYDCFKCAQEESQKRLKKKEDFGIRRFNHSTFSLGSSFISKTASLIKIETPTHTCDKGLFYSQLSSSCELITCCYGYSAVGSQCLDLQQNNKTNPVENANYENCLVNENTGLYAIVSDLANIKKIDKILFDKNSMTCRTIKNQSLKNLTLFQCNASINADDLNSLEENEFYIRNTFSHVNLSLFMISVRYQIYTDFYNLDFIRSFKDNKLCAQLEDITNLEGNFTNSCDYVTQNRIINNKDLILWVEVKNGIVTKKITTCKQYHLKSNCILRWLNNDYTLREEALTYKYLNVEYSFKLDQFVPMSEGFGVCESSFLKSEKQSILDYYVNLLSLILICVSIGCYLFILTTYTYFKELRVVSNFNIITLCAVLILSDSLLLVALSKNKNKILCECISIVLHWSLLAAYSWVLCMAIELTLKFSKFAPKLLSRQKFFTINICVSFVIPTLIVAVTCALEYTGAVYVGYGKNDHCWINGFYARVFSYIFPLSVILVSSSFCLFITIFNIKKVEETNKKTLGKGRTSNVNLVMITVKLILILGVPDVLVFVQISKVSLSKSELLFNSIFSTIFTCWRSSKGILLFMVYICNKSVLKIYKKSYSELTAKEASKTETQNDVTKESNFFTEISF